MPPQAQAGRGKDRAQAQEDVFPNPGPEAAQACRIFVGDLPGGRKRRGGVDRAAGGRKSSLPGARENPPRCGRDRLGLRRNGKSLVAGGSASGFSVFDNTLSSRIFAANSSRAWARLRPGMLLKRSMLSFSPAGPLTRRQALFQRISAARMSP